MKLILCFHYINETLLFITINAIMIFINIKQLYIVSYVLIYRINYIKMKTSSILNSNFRVSIEVTKTINSN